MTTPGRAMPPKSSEGRTSSSQRHTPLARRLLPRPNNEVDAASIKEVPKEMKHGNAATLEKTFFFFLIFLYRIIEPKSVTRSSTGIG